MVSGAGTAAVNGEYVENGLSANGNKAYTLYRNGAVAFNMWSYSSTGWLITSSAVDSSPVFENIYYQELTASTTPPALLSAAFSGALPTPTVAALTTRTVLNPVQRWRRSSDDALQMFTAKDIASGAALDFAVPTDVRDLYGSARYFNGSGTKVVLGSSITLVGDFSISGSFASMGDLSVSHNIIGNSSSSVNRVRISATTGVFSVNLNETASTNFNSIVIPPMDGVKRDFILSRSGLDITVTVSGIGSETVTANTNTLVLNQLGAAASSQYFNGVIYGLDFGTAAFTGLGTSVTAWEDTIGTNDGTETNGATFTGQGYDAYLLTEYDQSGNDYDLTQTTAANQPLVVSGGALTVDGVASYSALFDGVNDNLDFTGTFTGLTAANVYAITDNAGTVTLDTLTAQNITAVTTLDGLLASLTYDHVTFVAIYPDATDQAAIQAKILTQFSVT